MWGGEDGPLNAIAAAAVRTGDEPGGRIVMHAVYSSAGQPKPITITGHIVYEAGERSRGLITAPASESRPAMHMEVIYDDVQELGEEDVRGVPTTRYSGTVARSDGEAEGSPVRIEAWIDGDGLVRRMRMVKAPDGEGSSTDMTLEFYDFGFEPEIDVPDPSEVFDATEMAQG